MSVERWLPDMYWEDAPDVCRLRCGASGIEVAHMVLSKGGKQWEGFSDLPWNVITSGRWKPKEDMRRHLAEQTRAWFYAVLADRPGADEGTQS